MTWDRICGDAIDVRMAQLQGMRVKAARLRGKKSWQKQLRVGAGLLYPRGNMRESKLYWWVCAGRMWTRLVGEKRLYLFDLLLLRFAAKRRDLSGWSALAWT